MSDVEKTTSGLSDDEIKSTKIKSDLPAKTTTLKYQQQQQQQKQQHQYNRNHQQKLQQQSINHYSNSTSGSAVLTTPTPVDETQSCRNNCISRILKLIFSTPGLVLLVVGYSVMGALIFPLLEAPQDITKSEAIAKSREDCLRELWIITEKLNVLYERNWTMLVHEQLRRFEGSIVAATRNGGVGVMTSPGSRNGHSTALGHFGGSIDDFDQSRWSFSEALLYSVTVITTIGHGSLTPKTAGGKIATILYALIGVPLMLMCLSSLGALLAEALQCTYAKLCCHGRNNGSHDSDSVKRQGGHCNDTNLQKDNNGKCHGKGQGLNCKGCKYDSIMCETKLHHSYDYNEINSTGEGSLVHGSTEEDSCRLLHNSPKAKLNRNGSPCMQLKMTPQHAATIAQYYQQQKQQQQQQPQVTYNRLQSQSMQPLPPGPQRDVMLLATTDISTSTTGSTATMARSVATASPQHLPHLLQPATTTTFHIVSNKASPQLSASMNSSPMHYGNHQHQNNHHLPPPSHHIPQQLTMCQYGSNVPQHFVAIPSSMVRFQVTPTSQPTNNNSNTSSTNCTLTNVGSFTAGNSTIMPNCYQPTASASVAVTGAATIYFPIAGTIGATATMPRTTTSIGATSSQLLCNQPLVKYHTIQLQHKKPSLNDEVATSAGSTTVKATEPEKESESESTPLNVADTLPLPPPPAYQTATVHGVRRAKFITKPLPPEINTLLSGSDVNTTPFRHDLSMVQQQNNITTMAMTTPVTQTTTTMATNFNPTRTTTICTDNNSVLLLSTGCTTTISSTTTSMPEVHNLPTTVKGGESLVMMPTNATPTLPTAMATSTNCTFTGSNVTVDIMEDEEEEHEQQRLGNCPHGTPSRMPLIPSSSGGNGKHDSNSANPSSNDRDYDKTARGLINATAASFHRHTLHTFQRGGNGVCRNNRKSTLVTHHGGSNNGGNNHTSAIWLRRASTGCYSSDPNGDTSEDDDYHQHMSNERFALEQLNSGNVSEDTCDDIDETDDDLEQCPNNGPQVPISIVFLILICYVSLGTVIFALWENWSLIDGAYFCFVTLATIGYGDFLPERTFHGPEVQLFACCAYLLLGLVLVAMSFSILETQLMWKCKRIAVRLRLTKD